MGTPEQGGGANTIRKLNATIQVNSNVVHVAAVKGLTMSAMLRSS
jgi:hypothetical protein